MRLFEPEKRSYKTSQVLAFGIVSGVIWSFVPLLLLGHLLDRHYAPVHIGVSIVAGAVTGMAVTRAIATVLSKSNLCITIVVGLFTLPLGAFMYNVLTGSMSVVLHHSGVKMNWVSVPTGFFDTLAELFFSGLFGALASTVTVFAFVLIPLAIATTFLLQRFISYTKDQPPGAHA